MEGEYRCFLNSFFIVYKYIIFFYMYAFFDNSKENCYVTDIDLDLYEQKVSFWGGDEEFLKSFISFINILIH